MLLMLLIFAISLISLFISFSILLLVIRHIFLSKDKYNGTKSSEAILISGCDSGIGLELAKFCLKTTELKIICGFLNTCDSCGYKSLEDLNTDDRLKFIKLDLTSKDDIKNLVELIDELKSKNYFKNLVALINNAGVMTYGEFDWLTWEQIHSQIEVNFTGTVRITRALLPYIIESRGRVINISSVNDTTIFPGLSIYSATKSALSIFSKALGYEMRKLGVSVVTLRLGDFARLTNIMSKHKVNRDDMWSEMDNRKQSMYKDFFEEFNGHLLKNYGMTSPKYFEASSLFHDFERALLQKNPPALITCAPRLYRIIYFLIETLPIWLQYHLIDILIQVGFGWRPPPIAVDH